MRGSTRVSTVSLASGAGNKGVGGGEPSKSATSKQRKRVREVGETATFVRKQDSSIFGIVEGLGLQYKMGICGDAVHTEFYNHPCISHARRTFDYSRRRRRLLPSQSPSC